MTLYQKIGRNEIKPVYTGLYNECMTALGKILEGKTNAPKDGIYFIGGNNQHLLTIIEPQAPLDARD